MPLCIKNAAASASESIDQPTEEDANFGEVYDVRSVAREPDEETFLPVKDRQFPDLAPKGVIIGKLNVLPQLSFKTLYNDNLYATNVNETSDIAEHVIPAITVKTLQDRHFFGLQANAEIIRQLEQTSENRENYYVNAGGYFEARHDLLLPYNLTYTVDHQSRADNLSQVFTRDPLEISELVAEAGVAYRPNRIGLSATGRHIRKRYDDGVSLRDPSVRVVKSDADFNTNELELEASYEFPVNHTAFIRGTAGKTEFEDSIYDDGSNTYTGTFRDSVNGRILAGIITNYKGILLSDIGVGYAATNYDDESIDDVGSFAVDADIEWNITKLTTLGLNVTRSIVQDNEIVQGIVQTAGTFTVDHELQRNLLLNGYITYLNRDFENITREDDLYRLGLGVLYRPSPYFNIKGEYIHTNQDSTFDGSEFDQNIFMVRLTGQY